LRWLAFSSRSLSVEEISEIVAIDVERDPLFDRREVLEDPLDVLSICSSLVTITTAEESSIRTQNNGSDPARQVVALAHYSVKEYLISERSHQGRAARYSMYNADCNEIIARGCLGYLLQFQCSELLSEASIEEFKLAQYSAQRWISHAQVTIEQTEMFNRLAMKLFSKEDDAYLNWIRIHDPDRPWEGSQLEEVLRKVPAPLYYAARSGLTKIASLLLDKGADVNAQGGEYVNALQAASEGGHEHIVELLLGKGANVNAQAGKYGSALYAVSWGGHEQIVKLLLKKGANVNAQGGHYGNALQAASWGGHEQIVKLLLEKGAN
jgi:hypothetical protein